jgi:hypothetical protein
VRYLVRVRVERSPGGTNRKLGATFLLLILLSYFVEIFETYKISIFITFNSPNSEDTQRFLQ